MKEKFFFSILDRVAKQGLGEIHESKKIFNKQFRVHLSGNSLFKVHKPYSYHFKASLVPSFQEKREEEGRGGDSPPLLPHPNESSSSPLLPSPTPLHSLSSDDSRHSLLCASGEIPSAK